jgi:O-antigen/teichoic acid export membrane protein
VETAFAGGAASFLVGGLVGLANARLSVTRVSARDLARHVVEHSRHSGWMVGAALLQWSSGNYFLIAAGAVLGTATSGAIRAAQNLMGVTHVMFLALENVLPGRMARAWSEEGTSGLRRVYGKSLVAVVGSTLSFCAVVAIAPGRLIETVYGSGMRGYAPLLWWFAAMYPLVALGTVQRFALRALLVTRPFFLSYAAMSAISLLTAFPLVRGLGATGAMMGLLVTQLAGVAYLGAHVRKAMS